MVHTSLSHARTEVLNTLQRVAQQLVQLVGKKKGIPPNILESAGGRVVPYGSFRLGVYGPGTWPSFATGTYMLTPPGSDIDTLMVGPKHVHRNDFFEHMRELITKAFGADAIGEFTPVTDTSVPIIKTKLVGISIDLIYCSLMVSSVPAGLELTDNALLKGLDETDLRCVNGTRVTDMILQLVPQGKTFRHALRAVKHWAKQRAIYGNIVGFPGGVAWAMMVARICQLYPRATGSLIVSRFFHIMKSWKWPQPVLLTQVDSGPPGIAKVWNPKIYPGDKRHIMPVITPAFPSMCATHNVGHSTLMVIQRELNRASELVNGIFAGTKQWKDLFIPHTFFSEGYKHYISVNSASRTKEAQEIWSGFVESRLRRLVTGLETSQTSVQLAHPFMKGFKRVHHCKNDEEIDAVLQGSLQFQAKDSKTETTDDAKYAKQQAAAQEGSAEKLEMPAAQVESNGDGTESIHTTTFYVGIGLEKGIRSTLHTRTVLILPRCQTARHLMADSGLQANMHRLGSIRFSSELYQGGAYSQLRPSRRCVPPWRAPTSAK